MHYHLSILCPPAAQKLTSFLVWWLSFQRQSYAPDVGYRLFKLLGYVKLIYSTLFTSRQESFLPFLDPRKVYTKITWKHPEGLVNQRKKLNITYLPPLFIDWRSPIITKYHVQNYPLTTNIVNKIKLRTYTPNSLQFLVHFIWLLLIYKEETFVCTTISLPSLYIS